MLTSQDYSHLFEARTNGGVTPLMFAVQNPDLGFVNECLKSGMNPFSEDYLGQSVMSYASFHKVRTPEICLAIEDA